VSGKGRQRDRRICSPIQLVLDLASDKIPVAVTCRVPGFLDRRLVSGRRTRVSEWKWEQMAPKPDSTLWT
jgi:hypothetical protein